MKKTPSEFSLSVFRQIKRVRRGKVATYGQIARLAGNHRGARAVAWLLHSSSRVRGLPWQRIVSAQGKISFPWGTDGFTRQRRRLMSEGVEVGERGEINLAAYLWKPSRKKT
ncbi:MAG: MGMT family protein [Bdellovibrionota bacterium]